MTRLPSIDGLRGMAVLTVVVFHSFVPTFEVWPWWLNPGWIGVRLFFVLSGALIAGLLFQARDDVESGRTSRSAAWVNFAIRRALRIFPLAYCAMALAWWLGVPAMRESSWWHLTYTQNLGEQIATVNRDGLGHFWTLAIEEQVYLLWPIAILFAPRRLWMPLGLAACAVALLFRYLVWQHDWWALSRLPLYVIDAFAAGTFVAWSRWAGVNVTRGLAGWGALVLAVTVWFPDAANRAVLETGCVLLTAALVGWAFDHPHAPILSPRPLVWVGTISYGVYVWHEAAPYMLGHAGVPMPEPGWMLLAAKASLGIGGAALTWYGFERPINRLKDRINSHGRIGRLQDAPLPAFRPSPTFRSRTRTVSSQEGPLR